MLSSRSPIYFWSVWIHFSIIVCQVICCLAGGAAVEGCPQWSWEYSSASEVRRGLEAQCSCHQALQHLLKQRLCFLFMWDWPQVRLQALKRQERWGSCSERHKSPRDPGTRLQWPYSGAMNTLFPDPVPCSLLFSEWEIAWSLGHPQGCAIDGPTHHMMLVLFGSFLLSPVCVMKPLWSTALRFRHACNSLP